MTIFFDQNSSHYLYEEKKPPNAWISSRDPFLFEPFQEISNDTPLASPPLDPKKRETDQEYYNYWRLPLFPEIAEITAHHETKWDHLPIKQQNQQLGSQVSATNKRLTKSRKRKSKKSKKSSPPPKRRDYHKWTAYDDILIKNCWNLIPIQSRHGLTIIQFVDSTYETIKGFIPVNKQSYYARFFKEPLSSWFLEMTKQPKSTFEK